MSVLMTFFYCVWLRHYWYMGYACTEDRSNTAKQSPATKSIIKLTKKRKINISYCAVDFIYFIRFFARFRKVKQLHIFSRTDEVRERDRDRERTMWKIHQAHGIKEQFKYKEIYSFHLIRHDPFNYCSLVVDFFFVNIFSLKKFSRAVVRFILFFSLDFVSFVFVP